MTPIEATFFYLGLIIVVPIAIFYLAKIVFSAYFSAKWNFLKQKKEEYDGIRKTETKR